MLASSNTLPLTMLKEAARPYPRGLCAHWPATKSAETGFAMSAPTADCAGCFGGRGIAGHRTSAMKRISGPRARVAIAGEEPPRKTRDGDAGASAETAAPRQRGAPGPERFLRPPPFSLGNLGF
jgi:hypothetical protein